MGQLNLKEVEWEKIMTYDLAGVLDGCENFGVEFLQASTWNEPPERWEANADDGLYLKLDRIYPPSH